MLSLLDGALLIGSMLAASFAHEATHLAVARVFGREAYVVWLELYVEYELRPDQPIRNRLIGLAPQLVAVVAGLGITAMGAWPPVSAALPFYAAFGTYALLGGYSDYSQAAARGSSRTPDAVLLGYDHLDAGHRRAIQWLFVGFGILTAIGVVIWASRTGHVSTYEYYLAYPVVVVGFFVAMSQADKHRPGEV